MGGAPIPWHNFKDLKMTFLRARKLTPFPAHNRGINPGQSPMGYGAKITTRWMVQFWGERRWYRVYVTCFANAGTSWILRGGNRVIVDLENTPRQLPVSPDCGNCPHADRHAKHSTWNYCTNPKNFRESTIIHRYDNGKALAVTAPDYCPHHNI